MARYLLDTNIVAFIISGEYDRISADVAMILDDYASQQYVSSVSVVELLQLYRIKKIFPKNVKRATEIIDIIEKDLHIEILPFTKQHTNTLSILQIADRHNDPFDHAIISHAITEKLTLVSSDRKFEDYTTQKLKFVFNRR
ncbi:MAG TPA: type II toxin-antitoxin system VapC family toxin [Parapedobacter sp.]|uniref:type II toxin-antitoxin system VapC family toxin n=1 Tax=Parapedobacter sp. TaxID=1958893 RepID=UPI002BC262D4|nr:type II toxin-antitoxin system VapC family toxin [Parapedobacter sp.]HWK58494.1 type II toxin-antitoxin system VapC family toxin [Parapedobacter sp.]